MKFLIQKINGEIKHDFTFTLLESIRFKNWLHGDNKKDIIKFRYINSFNDIYYPIVEFKSYHNNYVPVGSVEFVSEYLNHFHNIIPKPINVPEELFDFTGRDIINGNHMDLENLKGKWFVKSNDKIKGFSEIFDLNDNIIPNIPQGNYQISEYLNDIISEWRAFVYNKKLVGLQNYSGDFTCFPQINTINDMISNYISAPVAYTLDIAVTEKQTIIIECHDFFSCGLYGFANHLIYPNMLSMWFYEYLHKNKISIR